jgi:hypothetical protein
MAALVGSNRTLPSARIFYGWFMVAAAFAVTFVGFASAYTFSAFVASLQRDFGASRGSIALVFSLAGSLYFGLGLVSGPLADHYSRHARQLELHHEHQHCFHRNQQNKLQSLNQVLLNVGWSVRSKE